MSLFQKAIETYDAMKERAGVYYEGEKAPLAPIAHNTTKPTVIITIDKNGNFISAEKYEGNKIIIPVTEKSASRSNNTMPHPLCDKLDYLSPTISPKKYAAYAQSLKAWCDSKHTDPKIEAILTYICNGTIQSDLDKFQIKTDEKTVCAWVVNGIEGAVEETWKDVELMRKFADFYTSSIIKEGLDSITGEQVKIAESHLRGVLSKKGNASLISSNDDKGFTFRGRFVNSDEACPIGYISSQKAHNALKWLLDNQGIHISDTCSLVCWRPSGKETPRPNATFFFSKNEYTPTQYKEEIKKIIMGYKSSNLPVNDNTVVIASFDAASTGRLANTYYSEIGIAEFVEKLSHWDETCCWYTNGWGTYSPSFSSIINYAFGSVSKKKDKTDLVVADKLYSKYLKQLINCRLNNLPLPREIVDSIMHKANNLKAYPEDKNYTRAHLLFIACALINKYRHDYFNEETNMELDINKQDRSYQFGRLLAVLEKMEKSGSNDSGRETNAIRMQSTFVQRPGDMTSYLFNKIESYRRRLKPSTKTYYEKLIAEIMDKLGNFEQDFNKPLEYTYLLGYHAQLQKFYEKKVENPIDNEEEM